MTDLMDRVAGAPISWGICEVPGWGLQLPVDRVLTEAAGLGLTAMEQGALGWLPTDPHQLRATLDTYGMSLVGGFVPMVLHDRSRRDEMRVRAHEVADTIAAAGGRYFVTAVVADLDDWSRPELHADAWHALISGLEEVDAVVADRGVSQVLHPHVDTLVEQADEVDRFLDGCDVALCLDTGHLTIGGADPVVIAERQSDRIGLVHLKDVDDAVAQRLRQGELGLMAATQAGLFPPLGDGVVPIVRVIETLIDRGYLGWYVIEQDVAITAGEPPVGEGPVLGVARSLEYLRSLGETSAGSVHTPA
ncbi:MAG TPA: sugar phosphate isomerase/epimerase [Ilumatobacteraceae bacterium]|nr:sugar phosphate isomerase/epimerase [Ilumatobacteraceae bacterium]